MTVLTDPAVVAAPKQHSLRTYPAVAAFTSSVLLDAIDSGTAATVAAALAVAARHAATSDADIAELRATFTTDLVEDVFATSYDLVDIEPATLEAVCCVIDELAWETSAAEFTRVLTILASIAAGVADRA